MQKKQDNSFVVKKIQDGLSKLISEEYFAYKLYMMSRFAVCKCGINTIDQLFDKIGSDELNDHMKELIKWCREYGYDVPCSDTEFSKFADKKIIKYTKELKKNKDAGYYLDQAIISENAAIESYKKVIGIKDICQFTDLQALLWHIYYDEKEHLDELLSAKIAFDANADLVMN